MKILVILQNMYSGIGVDKAAPVIFKINPRNKSGSIMLKICNHEVNKYVYFSNCSSICSGGGANSKGKTDLEFVNKAIGMFDWDVVIFGGNQSKQAYLDLQVKPTCQVILMPHPASRNLTNSLKNIARKIVGKKTSFELIQLKNRKVKMNVIKQ